MLSKFFRWNQQQSGTAFWYNNTCSCVLPFFRRWFHTRLCKSKMASENQAESSSLNHGLTTPWLLNQENTTKNTGGKSYELKGRVFKPPKKLPKSIPAKQPSWLLQATASIHEEDEDCWDLQYLPWVHPFQKHQRIPPDIWVPMTRCQTNFVMIFCSIKNGTG